MIRTTFLPCEHGDDLMPFGSMDGPRGSKRTSDDSYKDRDHDPHDPCDC